MPCGNPIRRKFLTQRRGAKRRGIAFHFTFEEWIHWWEAHLGPDWCKKRGTLHNQYVMARKGDKGPYHPDNVRCILSIENHAEHGHLSDDKIKAIFMDERPYLTILKEYHITSKRITDIKKRYKHAEITAGLTQRVKVTEWDLSGKRTYYR